MIVLVIVRDCGSDEGAAVRRFAVCFVFQDMIREVILLHDVFVGEPNLTGVESYA